MIMIKFGRFRQGCLWLPSWVCAGIEREILINGGRVRSSTLRKLHFTVLTFAKTGATKRFSTTGKMCPSFCNGDLIWERRKEQTFGIDALVNKVSQIWQMTPGQDSRILPRIFLEYIEVELNKIIGSHTEMSGKQLWAYNFVQQFAFKVTSKICIQSVGN